MKRIGLLGLLVLPLLMGQLCGITEPSIEPPPTDEPDPPPPPPPPAAKVVTGPGFTLTLPAGFRLHEDTSVTVRANFVETYVDGEQLVAVYTETPLPDGPYNFECNTVRVQNAQVSDSGDWMLVTRIFNHQSRAENLAAYCLLAGGDLLCVEICPGRALTAEDQDFGAALFRSIVLQDTDGRALEQRMRARSRKLLGRTERGLMVLDDLSAWVISDAAPEAALTEMLTWQRGDPIHIQGLADANDATRVSRWIAVPVRPRGMAVSTTIGNFDPATRNLSFTNGQSKILPYAKLPPVWEPGDEVLIVHDVMGDWLIRVRTWHWMRI
jgi:hypothetical protein